MATPLDWYNLRHLYSKGFAPGYSDTTHGRMHWVSAEGGGRHTVVLVHGLGSRGSHYRRLCDALLPEVGRIFLPDLLGHGFSDTPPPEELNARTLQRGLDDFLDEVLDRPGLLYGNSLGGRGVLCYGASRPERVRGLVVTSPAGGRARSLSVKQVTEPFLVRTYTDAMDLADRIFARPVRMKPAVAWAIRRQLLVPQVITLLKNTDERDVIPPEKLRGLKPPALFIWGRAERVLPREHLEYFRENLPDHVQFEEPEDYGHSAYIEHPEDLAKRILRFAETI